MNFSGILTHPEKDFIISELVSGKTPKEINQYLKVKYTKPEQKHLVLSANILKEFIDKHINIYNQLEKDLQDQQSGQLNTKVPASLLSNKTYQERLVELAGQEIDVIKSLERIVIMLEQRLEQVFDKMQINPSDTGNDDYILIKIHDSLMSAVEKYDKYKNNRPDMVVQHNVSVQMVENYTMVLQEAIRETLMQLDPDTASRFMDIFSDKLNKLKLPTSEDKSDVKIRLSDVKQLEEKIEANLQELE